MTVDPSETAGQQHSPTSVLWQRAADIRYGISWQWTAIQMQYERLMARSMSPNDLVETAGREHMRGVVDMDLFVTAVRRLRRVAEQAKRSGCDTSGELKRAVMVFDSRWSHVIAVRNRLEHVDGPGVPIVPMQSSADTGRWQFITPNNVVDVQRLFEDAKKLVRAIAEVIKPFD